MNTSLPKVCVPFKGIPMIRRVLSAVSGVGEADVWVVVGYKSDVVLDCIKDMIDVRPVLQKEQLGTGHAVKVVMDFAERGDGSVMVLPGDVPLVRTETLKKLLDKHREERATITLLTIEVEDPSGYGRVIRDQRGLVTKIVEDKDATQAEKSVCEVNSGIYVFEECFLRVFLPLLNRNNKQGEYYLTDLLNMAFRENRKITAVKALNPVEAAGINTMEQLSNLEKIAEEEV